MGASVFNLARRAGAVEVGDLGVARSAERATGRGDGKHVFVVAQRAGQGPRIGVAAVGREAGHRGSRGGRPGRAAAGATDQLQRAELGRLSVLNEHAIKRAGQSLGL